MDSYRTEIVTLLRREEIRGTLNRRTVPLRSVKYGTRSDKPFSFELSHRINIYVGTRKKQ